MMILCLKVGEWLPLPQHHQRDLAPTLASGDGVVELHGGASFVKMMMFGDGVLAHKMQRESELCMCITGIR